MSESTRESLSATLDNVAETVAKYARQIQSGEYGNRWTVTDHNGDERHVFDAIDDDDAFNTARTGTTFTSEEYDEWTAERDDFDQPTIADENGNESAIDDWPLSVEVKIGRPLAVVIGTGGPHIEIVQDLSVDGRAKLAGYWGGESVYRHGDVFQTVLDYFMDALYDEAPEEYK